MMAALELIVEQVECGDPGAEGTGGRRAEEGAAGARYVWEGAGFNVHNFAMFI